MLPEQRRIKILDLMNRQGAADVPGLAKQFDVSMATVRRDLQLLEGRGHITRTHGGAVANYASAAFEPRHHEKVTEHTTEKRAIAAVASRRVSDGEVVILDSGSTTLALARELRSKQGLTIITTDLKIALELSDVPGFDVIIVGGTVRPQLYSVVGAIAESILIDLHANHAFLGADAIDLETGVSNASISEVRVKQLAIASAEQTILIADHSKFGRVSLVKIADLREFSEVITDSRFSRKAAELYQDAGVGLTYAEVE